VAQERTKKERQGTLFYQKKKEKKKRG